ncbi:MAG: hypothetical protein EBQ96_08680 [Proteobacteria bacterium]|nr:hypothetical protein [Pseudomonadota bacterium]
MTIKISQPVAANGAAQDFDVRQIKKALNRLGYYQPFEKTGITGIPDAPMFSALKAFQKDRGLNATGVVRPDDETEAALNEANSQSKDGQYIWRTVGDDKVRAEHAALSGTIRKWSDAPDPGDDYNCRCWAEEIDQIDDPPIQPVYPELLLVPLLRLGRLYNVWKLWSQSKDPEWTLGGKKSATRWGNQLRNRNWTPEQITKTIKNGVKYPAPNKVNTGNTATRYEYDGRFVVKDDQTNEILQVSGPKFEPNKLP